MQTVQLPKRSTAVQRRFLATILQSLSSDSQNRFDFGRHFWTDFQHPSHGCSHEEENDQSSQPITNWYFNSRHDNLTDSFLSVVSSDEIQRDFLHMELLFCFTHRTLFNLQVNCPTPSFVTCKFNRSMSTWTTVFLALYRVISIYAPFQRFIKLDNRNAKKMIIASFFISFIACMGHFSTFIVSFTSCKDGNNTIVEFYRVSWSTLITCTNENLLINSQTVDTRKCYK